MTYKPKHIKFIPSFSLLTVLIFFFVSTNLSADMMRNDTVKQIADDFWNRDIDRALSGVGEYIENQPENPLGYFLQGKVAYKRGDVEKARLIINRILDMDDARDLNVYFNDTYERAEKFKKIIK